MAVDLMYRGDPLDALTGQERRILDLIGAGLTNREISARLGIAEKTVKNYVTVLFAKLGMTRRTQAAAYIARRLALAETSALTADVAWVRGRPKPGER